MQEDCALLDFVIEIFIWLQNDIEHPYYVTSY